jgi:hypothetical protein
MRPLDLAWTLLKDSLVLEPPLTQGVEEQVPIQEDIPTVDVNTMAGGGGDCCEDVRAWLLSNVKPNSETYKLLMDASCEEIKSGQVGTMIFSYDSVAKLVGCSEGFSSDFQEKLASEPFDLAWTMLKSYTSSPATPDGKIVPSFHGVHLNNIINHGSDIHGDRELREIGRNTSYQSYAGREPTRNQHLYRLPPGYGSAEEREVTVPAFASSLMNEPKREWYLAQQLADETAHRGSMPVAIQQPRPDTNTEKIQYEWVDNPNYIQAYGQEEMLHPSNWYTSNFWQDQRNILPESERVVPDDSYFTANA